MHPRACLNMMRNRESQSGNQTGKGEGEAEPVPNKNSPPGTVETGNSPPDEVLPANMPIKRVEVRRLIEEQLQRLPPRVYVVERPPILETEFTFDGYKLTDADESTWFHAEEFLSRIEKNTKGESWTDSLRIQEAHIRCVGAAETMIRIINWRAIHTWAQFKSAFMNIFDIPTSSMELTERIVATNRYPGEIVGWYISRLHGLIISVKERLLPLDEVWKLYIIQRALIRTLPIQCHYLIENASTVAQLTEKVEEWVESHVEYGLSTEEVGKETTSLRVAMDNKGQQAVMAVKEGAQKTQPSSNRGPCRQKQNDRLRQHGRCFRCFGIGHRVATCPGTGLAPGQICRCCLGDGHLAKSCPTPPEKEPLSPFSKKRVFEGWWAEETSAGEGRETCRVCHSPFSEPSVKASSPMPSSETSYERMNSVPEIRGQLLGQGGFGTVYRGREKDIAIKVIGARNMQDGVKEINILSQLDHPNIVAYKGGFYNSNKMELEMYMELCDGGDLWTDVQERASSRRPYTEISLTIWLKEAFSALQYIYRQHIVHRDIKPPNLLIHKNHLKLGDFGLAKIFSTHLDAFNASVYGTPCYASPEFLIHNYYDHLGDVWSMGATFITLINLEPPFDTPEEIRAWTKGQIELDEIDDMYRPRIRRLINDLMDIDKGSRPSADRVLKRLRRWK